jgi:hypothetical protein
MALPFDYACEKKKIKTGENPGNLFQLSLYRRLLENLVKLFFFVKENITF